MGGESRKVWARRVARWSKSGQSCAEFAAREGVKAKTLEWWRWRLRSASEQERPPLVKADVAFVELEPAVLEKQYERIEVALANGRVVRVPFVFSDDVLGRVLSVAERQ